ncbi:DUF2163 domain-containing protein [Pannonibacter sp. SL95]|uniref:DUF2163 domain-containing protein n=1 Tax=Pannonibacter sp. SL95 TaxID=2995153 RepID=UPI002272E4B6|nr:DUF2163 domain-containing protein [Pannonibacter sp. SL95]MCY1708608.1 DUF2163 domain-containing protein [Pannonibacter sp. SL95]
MKTLDPGLAAHLAGRMTSLCAVWILTRSDGQRLGFTDHDRSLTVDGVVCHPARGMEASADTRGPGLAAGGGEVSGALDTDGPVPLDGFAEADLEAGRWDGAEVAVHLVNWAQPVEAVLLRRAVIGEVTRAGRSFRAELRGLGHLLEARRGRVFASRCDADLGDTRCGIALTDPRYRAVATVSWAADARELTVTGLTGFDAGWFDGGRFAVLNGPLTGFAGEIARHARSGAAATLSLWLTAPQPIGAGTQIEVTAGCDKRFATCRAKFANASNFRGFPHMPGTDFVLAYPGRNTGENDGGALVG